jgi:hypothetical protein
LYFVVAGALSALIALFPLRIAAQAPATGAIAGRITTRADSGAAPPAAGTTVGVIGLRRATIADGDGRFLLGSVPARTVTLRFQLTGHRTVERTVRVRVGDTVHVDLELETDAQLLSPVRTEARAEDVELFVSRPNVATTTVGKAAMAGVPSVGEPDVVRVVQLLPGVVARNDYSTGLNVRGGEADQNLVLLDGHPIYNPFHLGGIFSTFMDATVGSVQLMTGAFPARFGGRLSSVLDVRSATEARPGINTTADLSVLGASARLSGVVAGGRGTWSVAGRRTYADAVTEIFTDNLFPYHFRDFHARASYLLPRDVRVTVTGYVGKDVLDANMAEIESDSTRGRADEGEWSFDWGNQVLGASIAKDVGINATLEQRVSTSGFSTVLDLGDGALVDRNEIRDLRLGGSLTVRGTAHDRSFGYEVATHRVRYHSESPATGTTGFDIRQRPLSAAVWLDDLWRVSPKLLLELGMRGEALTGRNWAGLSPRVSMKYFVRDDLALSAGAGRVTQWLHSLAGDGPLRYFDVWIASDSFVPVATAWHWVAGAERRLRDAGSVRIEGYYKRYDRVMEANWSEDPQRRGDEFFSAEGSSYGIDLLARWLPRSGPAGWISYSYGVSSRWRDGVRWSPGHDRRHDVDVVATWRLAKYRLGTRFGYATGTPYTPIIGEIARRMYDPSRDSWGTGGPRIFLESLGGRRNSARFPATHRLDLDISREFTLRGATLAPYASVVNAYNAKNVFVYLYEYSTDLPTRRALSQFPVLPSVGVRVEF